MLRAAAARRFDAEPLARRHEGDRFGLMGPKWAVQMISRNSLHNASLELTLNRWVSARERRGLVLSARRDPVRRPQRADVPDAAGQGEKFRLSREIRADPTMRPKSSSMGEMESDTSTSPPSLVRRTAS